MTWDEGFRQRARVFDLVPGMGGYMPSTTGHMVENGPEPSITISFTYYTDSTRANELLYRGNARLRRLGLRPQPIGASPTRDRIKHAVLATAFGDRPGAHDRPGGRGRGVPGVRRPGRRDRPAILTPG